jgi:hypothetical protein
VNAHEREEAAGRAREREKDTETGKVVPTLEYAPPEVGSTAQVVRSAAYVVAVVWSGVLGVPLVSEDASSSFRNVAALTAGTFISVVFLLRSIGNVGCVAVFIVYAMIALAILWLSL